MDHWNKLGLIKKECVQLSKSVTKCLLFIIIHNFSTYTVFSTAPCIERTKSKQNQNQVTSHSNWPRLLLFNLVHKQCNGIIKGWLHYLTSESKGRFLVNNISMFGSTWCLVIDWTFRTLTNPPLPPAHPHTSNNISYMLIFAVQFPQSFERFTRNSATTVRFHKLFWVILVRFSLHSDWIRIGITPNTDTFYAFYSACFSKNILTTYLRLPSGKLVIHAWHNF